MKLEEYDLHGRGMMVDDALAFPDAASIPAHYHRSPNPGIVFIRV